MSASKSPILLLSLVGLIVGQLALAQTPTSGPATASSSSSGSSSVVTIRLRANKLRRPESCRESLPRKSEDLPALVIIGRVKELYMASAPISEASNSSPIQSQPDNLAGNNGNNNKALVNIGRVIKGNQQLLGADIIVSGFNSSSSQPCPNYVKQNDTLILLLNQDGGADRKFSIQNGNLLSMSLNNLDRINAIASDEPFKRRPPIEDILCEAHYCAYGRCAIISERTGQVSCQCPDNCPPLPSPVCGSDNTTYTNECHLIKEGCRLKRPLFVTKESAC